MKHSQRFVLSTFCVALFLISPFMVMADTSIEEKTKTAREYLAGKLPDSSQSVTYTGPPITVRYATFMSPAMKSWYESLITPSIEALKRESNGKLIVKPYFTGVLHGARAGFEACSQGISDFDHCYSAWKGKSFKLIHSATLPFAFPDAAVGSMVMEELYPKYFKEEYERQGVYLQNISVLANHHLFTRKKAIRKLEDLKGMKVAAAGGITAQVIKSLGAIPIISPPTEFYTGFQRGVFDAVLTMDAGAINFRVHELAKYRTEVNLTTQLTEYCLNKDFFDGLPKDLKTVFYNWSRTASQTMGQIYFELGGAKALKIFEEVGIETIVLSPTEIARWKAASQPVVERFITENEADGLPAKALLADMKRLTDKYSKMTWNELTLQTIEKPIQGIIDF